MALNPVFIGVEGICISIGIEATIGYPYTWNIKISIANTPKILLVFLLDPKPIMIKIN